MTSRPAPSSIAMALAGKTPSVDIPKSRDPRRPFTTNPITSTGTGISTRQFGQPTMLPTPPSSISPSLNPHGFKNRVLKTPDSPPLIPEHVESDIDLHDAVDLPKPGNKLVPEALDSLDNAEAITPVMLAANHLPDILLNHGPLAIRHIMGYLTTSVPGFSSIPPAKARRLVVGALEGKSGFENAGDDVEFEKVGWGRWDAKRRGHHRRPSIKDSSSPNFSPAYYTKHSRGYSRGSTTTTNPHIKDEHDTYGSSFAAGSAVFSHSEWGCGGQSMIDEADKMSLDGDMDMDMDMDNDTRDRGYCSSTQASDDDELMHGDWDEADATDEEDWAQIGAAALRARLQPSNASLGGGSGRAGRNGRGTGRGGDAHSYVSSRSKRSGGGPAWSTLTKSAPAAPIPITGMGFAYSNGNGNGGDVDERAAVEALLQMGSM